MATQKKAPAKKAAAKKAPAKKAPAKKAPAKKAVVKKASAKKAATPKTPVKKAPGIKAKMTKTAILNEIATNTNRSRAQVNSVMDELESVIERHITQTLCRRVHAARLAKDQSSKRPATKKRMGRNPATGEEIVIPAKPATARVRVTALKKLKDMIV